MKKIPFTKKYLIMKEARHISVDDILYSEWLDNDTWVCWGIPWIPKLSKLRQMLDDLYDLPEDTESENGIIMIEYHADKKRFWYGLAFEDETITITGLLSSNKLNHTILKQILKPVRNVQKIFA